MGILSDLFSGKRKREQAAARIQANAAAFAFAGISILSPMKAFGQNAQSAPAEKAKTEMVDSAAKQIKFKDAAVQSAAERMMKTPTGRKVLEGLHALNVDVSYDSSVSEDLGGFYSGNLRIFEKIVGDYYADSVQDIEKAFPHLAKNIENCLN